MRMGNTIAFGAGDFAQNLLYPAVSMYLLFFYTEVFGLSPASAATMFLVAQIVDIVWNPVVGAFIDRMSPPWGKYRTYLIAAGIPFAALSVMCFVNPLGDAGEMWKLVYAYATFIGFSMLFTLLNVAYGALGASLTRDTDEMAVLTAVRILMANTGCLLTAAGVPVLVAFLAGCEEIPAGVSLFMGLGLLPSFLFMPLVPALRRRLGKRGLFFAFAPLAIVGMSALYVVSRAGLAESHPWLVHCAQFVKASGIVLATGCMWAFVPDVITYAERKGGRRLSGIITAIMGLFFRLGMAFGRIFSGVVLACTGYMAAAEGSTMPADSRAWLVAMSVLALVALASLVVSFAGTRERFAMDAEESARVGAADLWNVFRGCRPLRLLALFFFLAFAMMSVGNAAGAYFMNGLSSQTPLAQEGIRWLVCVIPSVFAVLSAVAMALYPLSDDVVDNITRELEQT